MIATRPDPPGFWRTVRLLLAAARSRSIGRQAHQQQLLSQRSGSGATDWGCLGLLGFVVFMAALNVCAAFCVREAVESGQQIEVRRQGKIVVSDAFFAVATKADVTSRSRLGPTYYTHEATRIARRAGGSEEDIAQTLRKAVGAHGSGDLIAESEASPGLRALATSGPVPMLLGSLVLLWWLVMMALQGEGVELDTQRRRHPMWEWLFSHPIPAGAVFFAEMLSPLAANPVYWSGPLFCGVVYTFVYGPGLGLVAGLLVGVPVTVAAACMGKALEIAVILRFPARSRGAMIGLMSWAAFASLMLFFVGLLAIPRVVAATSGVLVPLSALPWPFLGWLLGAQADGTFLFSAGVASCMVFAVVATAVSVWFSTWGAQRGLSGNLGRADITPAGSPTKAARFGKDPMYRKEFLWFARDRSAIVQSILIPLTIASFQLVNLRGLLSMAQGAWNYLCGAAILFGTYFLWVLGPRSLSSEGSALWIAMTWPRGLESLLKAKAWLWSMISTGIVAIVLAYVAFVFPASIWQIALVGVGWFLFARSMAEKTVTLVTVTSASGEQEKIPWGRRMAAQLGMLTFAIGILTRQWHLAVIGIVFSWLTAAAMWQNFRARLPFLFDPWSEEPPPAPTLMHAMVAISILIELAAVLAGGFAGLAGQQYVGVALSFGYVISAVVVCVGTEMFLRGRGVDLGDVIQWQSPGANPPDAVAWWRDRSEAAQILRGLLMGAVCGLSIGLLARGYEGLLHFVPAADELLRQSQEKMATLPGLRVYYAVMAIGFAPFAEEYLFRGLLYRALDREWGGWSAVLGSAAFFAIYHPVLAWLPVFMLGAANALVFKKTGDLLPAVILHMVYNAVVLA